MTSMQSYHLPDDAAVEYEDQLLGHVECEFSKGKQTPKSEHEEAALAFLVDVVGFGSRDASPTATTATDVSDPVPDPEPDKE